MFVEEVLDQLKADITQDFSENFVDDREPEIAPLIFIDVLVLEIVEDELAPLPGFMVVQAEASSDTVFYQFVDRVKPVVFEVSVLELDEELLNEDKLFGNYDEISYD